MSKNIFCIKPKHNKIKINYFKIYKDKYGLMKMFKSKKVKIMYKFNNNSLKIKIKIKKYM